MQTKSNDIFASLDIGSSKIVCLIGYVNSDGKLYIRGIAHQESKGIIDCEISDVKLLTRSIIGTISFAEKMAGVNIDNIILNISGSTIKSNLITLENDFNNKVITKNDLLKLAQKIEVMGAENKHEIIHLIPINYFVNNIKIENPFDMNVEQFKVTFNTIMVNKIKMENLKNCLKKTPLNIAKIAYTPYVSGLGCLTEVEMKDGVLLIDIGAGNSAYSIFHNNIFIYGGAIKIAGNSITDDISKMLNIKFETAEKIKVKNTNLCLDNKEEQELIKIDIDSDEDFMVAKNKIKVINDIFRKRIQEITLMVIDILKRKNIFLKVQKIVVTGGCASVAGIDNFINDITDIETKVGIPEFYLVNNNIESKQLKNPIYSCAIGLLHYLKKIKNSKFEDYKNLKINKFKKFFDSLINIFIS